jgi:hypothetical protein
MQVVVEDELLPVQRELAAQAAVVLEMLQVQQIPAVVVALT